MREEVGYRDARHIKSNFASDELLYLGEMMEDPTPCGGMFQCPNGTECRGEWEVQYVYAVRKSTVYYSRTLHDDQSDIFSKDE